MHLATAQRLERITALIAPCPAPNCWDGYDSCSHGVWPCDLTKAAWYARGLDPAEDEVEGSVGGGM